ncbi:uncharacterized protein A1O5_11148 [Cladophialophora psammophila CBS 110553]|uniref:Uncharacterized protein n=1 Tax=Cladophialophora psammophila CBS 110553 TaxID=1182543 RepID=W9WLU7_9EURO|nr:uncharacterized protein A1O5_11148 [Cladophialophora psammophila CBS 110553]EXJ65621.1 hypothetical protein A1O5_11148 [Cladophialophora psammophila CBS 110553]
MVGGEVAAAGAGVAEAAMMSGGLAAADAEVLGQTAGRFASSSGSTEFFSALGSTASDSSALRSLAGSEASGLEELNPILSSRRRPQSLGPSYSGRPPWEGPGFRNHPASEGGAYQNWDIPGQGAGAEGAEISRHYSTSTESEWVREQVKGKQTAADWYTSSGEQSSTGAVRGSVSESSEISAESISKGWSTEAADGSQSHAWTESFDEVRTPSQISSTGAVRGSQPRPLSDSMSLSSEESTGSVVHHTPPNDPGSMEAIDGSAEALSISETDSVAELSTVANDGSREQYLEGLQEGNLGSSMEAIDGSGEQFLEEMEGLTREGGVGMSEDWAGASMEAIDGSRFGSKAEGVEGEVMEAIEGEVIYDGHSLPPDSPVPHHRPRLGEPSTDSLALGESMEPVPGEAMESTAGAARRPQPGRELSAHSHAPGESMESTGTVVRHPRPGAEAAAGGAPEAAAGPKKVNEWQDIWTADEILKFPRETRFNILKGDGKTTPIFWRPGLKADVKTYSSWGKAVRNFVKKEGAFTGEEACILFYRKPGQLTGREFVEMVGKSISPKQNAKLYAMSGEEFAKLTAPQLQKLLPRLSRYNAAKAAFAFVAYGLIAAGYTWGNVRGFIGAEKMKPIYKDVYKRSESEPASPAAIQARIPQARLVVTEGLTWAYTDPLPALGIYTANDTTSQIFDGDYITVPMSTGPEYTLTFPPEVQRIHLTNAGPRPICVAGANITSFDGDWMSLSGNLGAHFNVDHYETGQQVMNGSTSCVWIDNSPEGIGIPGITFQLVPDIDAPLGDNGTDLFMWPSLNDTYRADTASSKGPFNFSGHLVKSQLGRSSAKRLCENQFTKGPHFVSLDEKLYCDMETRQVYPTCGSAAEDVVCFDVKRDELVEPDGGNRGESEVKTEGAYGSFSKRRLKITKNVKVLKSFKHVHVWE